MVLHSADGINKTDKLLLRSLFGSLVHLYFIYRCFHFYSTVCCKNMLESKIITENKCQNYSVCEPISNLTSLMIDISNLKIKSKSMYLGLQTEKICKIHLKNVSVGILWWSSAEESEFHCWGPSSVLGWGTKIPSATWCRQKKKKWVGLEAIRAAWPRVLGPGKLRMNPWKSSLVRDTGAWTGWRGLSTRRYHLL